MVVKPGVDVSAATHVDHLALLPKDVADERLVLGTGLAEDLFGLSLGGLCFVAHESNIIDFSV